MYSLYRAWFGDENYSHLETLAPPDTVVRVGNEGEHQFVAHRIVLATHSGYLKALLSTSESIDSSSIAGDSQRITSISVSSIGGEAFAPLLNYMYTGHLEVTLDNIYSVLLATHLLHMPGALEQCRAALLRLRGPPPPPPVPPPLPPTSLSSNSSRSGTTLYRPVPNRFVGPPLCWPQSNLYPSASVPFSHLSNLQLSSGIPAIQNSRIIHDATTTATTTSYSFRMNSPGTSTSLSSSCHPMGKSQKSYGASVKGSKIKIKDNTEELSKINNREMEEIKKEQADARSAVARSISNSFENSEKINIINLESSSNQKSSGRSSRASNDNNSIINSNGVVLDIACCDGPVIFHRVLNENYTTPLITEPDIHSRIKVTQICASSSRDGEIIGENDENGRPDRVENEDSNGNSNGSSGNYTCEYCRHTFKSHYCYKKHAKRHLLPSSGDENSIGRTEERRREVRQLDLNVQYYPCKICGGKFPSYYFVHKHRKLCHSSADERNTDVETDQTIEAIASSSKS